MAEELPVRHPGVDLEKKKVRFDYIKSNYFRVIHAEGVIGGLGPRGQVQIAIWNERWPIPKQTAHELDSRGILGEEVRQDRVTRDAVVREVEAEIVMDLDTARKTREWLQKMIEAAEKREKRTADGQ